MSQSKVFYKNHNRDCAGLTVKDIQWEVLRNKKKNTISFLNKKTIKHTSLSSIEDTPGDQLGYKIISVNFAHRSKPGIICY